MLDYLRLPLGDQAPEVVNAVVEIPLQSINKYEYDKKLHAFRLDRNLYSPVHFPGDYGFFPSTLGRDADPLDVLILVDSPSFSGCIMEVRPIGVLDMLDQGIHDEKLLAVATAIRATKMFGTTRRFIHISCARLRTSFPSTKTLRANASRPRGGRTRPSLAI
jgi:inorganic pyrophosphatase